MPEIIEVRNDGLKALPEDFYSNDQEVKEILGHPPSWILRWGILTFFTIVMGIVALSFVIKYPDVANADIIITSTNPPITVFANAAGKIERLLVEDQQKVRNGDLLLIIESEVDYNSILSVKSALVALNAKKDNFSRLKNFQLPEANHLGGIQTSYGALQFALDGLQYFLKEHAVFTRIEGLREEINRTRELIASIGRQISIQDEEVRLEQKKYKRTQKLALEGLVSQEDLEGAEKLFLNTKRSQEQLKMSITNNELSIERLNAQINDLKSGRRLGLSDKISLLEERMAMVEKEVLAWEYNYLIRAGQDGSISLLNFHAEKEYIKREDPLLIIVPDFPDSTSVRQIIARAKIDQSSFGKIETGNQVKIELASYPAKEYGVLSAQVEDISLVPIVDETGNRFYSTDIPLANPMKTNYDKTIPYKPNQSGKARIITANKSIAARIFEQFIDLIKNT